MIEMRIVCDNAYHDRGHGVCSFCVQKRIEKARQEEREHCLRLIEAPIPGLREYAAALAGKPQLGMVESTINTLMNTAQAVRESGEFTDELRRKKGESQEHGRLDARAGS